MPTGIYNSGQWEKGQVPWIKGKKHSEESKKKMSLAKIGKKCAFRRKYTEETRKKMSEARKGTHPSEETRKKLSEARKGGKAYNWKGEEVSYSGLHSWISRELGKPEKCTDCGKVGEKKGRKWDIEWSNCDHKYSRAKEDFTARCVQCHGKYDSENNLRRRK